MRHCQLILAVSLLALLNVVVAISVQGTENIIGVPPFEVSHPRISVADSFQETLDLRLGEPLVREAKGGDTHRFQILLTAGHFMHLSVEQQGINVVLNLRSSDGKLLAEMDSPNNTFGPECMSWIAEFSGEINLEVRSIDKAANPGRIVVLLEELRPTLANDRNRVSAERMFMEAHHFSSPKPSELEELKITLGESRQKAIARFKEALPEWRAATDIRGEAMTYFRIGQIYKLLGDYKMALENFDTGLAMHLEPRDWRLTAGMLNDAGVVYDNKNEFDRALTLLGQAKRLFEEKGDRRGLASAHNNVAHVLAVMGNPSEALKEFQHALVLRQLEHDRSGEVNVLNNLGATYDVLGDPHLALKYFSQATEIWRELGSRSKIPTGLNNSAVMLEKLGEWQKAIDNYREALDLYREIGDRSGEADALDNLGDMYESLGNPAEARDHYSKALNLARKVGNKGTEANVLAHIGRLDASEDKLDEALKNYNQSLDIPQSKRRQAEALTGIGSVYVLKGNLPEALNYYEKALKLRREGEDSRGVAVTLDRLARALLLSGKRKEALESYRQSIDIWRKVEDQVGLASSLVGTSLIQREAGNLTESLKLSNEAITIVESLRRKVTNHQLRTSYFATKQNYYEHLIDVQMDFYKRDQSTNSLEGAFEASERSRARSLIDTLNESRTDPAHDSSVEVLRGRREIQAKLEAKSAALTRILNGAHRNDQLQQLRREFAGLIAEDAQLWAKIKISNPNYAALVQPNPRTTAEIQQLLDRATLLLEYALGDKRSYVFAVTSDLIKGIELPARDQIEPVARRVTEALTARNREVKNESVAQKNARVNKADQDYIEASAALSKMMLEPVASLLGQKRLVIVADGALQTVPFGALPVPFGVVPEAANSTTAVNSNVMANPATTVDSKAIANPFTAVNSTTMADPATAANLSPASSSPLSLFSQTMTRSLPLPVLIPSRTNSSSSGGSAQMRLTAGSVPTLLTAGDAPMPLMSEHEIVYLPSASVLALQRRELANRKSAQYAVAVLADPVFDTQDSRVAKAMANATQHRKDVVGTPRKDASQTGQGSAALPKQNELSEVPKQSGPSELNQSEQRVPLQQGGQSVQPKQSVQTPTAVAAPPKTQSILASALRDVGLDPNQPMPRLPYSLREAKAILQAAGANQSFSAVDFKASRQTATSPELSKYRIIHFATHGVLDLEHPELSGIVLSMVDEKGRPQDGYLRLHEIYNLNLPAELVVLSACQTGVGKQIKGEGLIALTRGFMYAGAKSIVASLWKVDDAATSALMAEFYKQMFVNKLKPAAALREAQLKISQDKRWQSPYYWAGFFLQGEWN